jgi:hypothetical protein
MQPKKSQRIENAVNIAKYGTVKLLANIARLQKIQVESLLTEINKIAFLSPDCSNRPQGSTGLPVGECVPERSGGLPASRSIAACSVNSATGLPVGIYSLSLWSYIMISYSSTNGG